MRVAGRRVRPAPAIPGSANACPLRRTRASKRRQRYSKQAYGLGYCDALGEEFHYGWAADTLDVVLDWLAPPPGLVLVKEAAAKEKAAAQTNHLGLCHQEATQSKA